MKDSKIRTATKTITWRITATLTTMILVYIFTVRLDLVFAIGSIEIIAKLCIYYLHERIWEHLSWQRK